MSITKNIKNHSFCDVHSCNHRANVCAHIKVSLTPDHRALSLIPVFLERIIIDKYYEQYWLCGDCAKKHDIDPGGELYFDPKLRELLDLDDDSDEDDDDDLKVELKQSLQDHFEQVCLDCFNEKYGSNADVLKKSVDEFRQISIRD